MAFLSTTKNTFVWLSTLSNVLTFKCHTKMSTFKEGYASLFGIIMVVLLLAYSCATLFQQIVLNTYSNAENLMYFLFQFTHKKLTMQFLCTVNADYYQMTVLQTKWQIVMAEALLLLMDVWKTKIMHICRKKGVIVSWSTKFAKKYCVLDPCYGLEHISV